MRSEFQDGDMPEILTQIYNHNFTEAQYVGEDCMKFMKDQLSRGYAKESTTVAKEEKCWY